MTSCSDPGSTRRTRDVAADHPAPECATWTRRKRIGDIREAALDWIDQMQLNRRNLTPDQVSLLRGRRYNRAEKRHPGPLKDNGQNVRQLPTSEKLAKEHGVTERTIRRDGQFAEAVEKVKAIDPDIEQKIAKSQGPTKKAILEAAEVE